MLVYGSLDVGALVLIAMTMIFSLTFNSISRFGFAKWISEYGVEVVSRFIPKGLGIPWWVLARHTVKLEGGVSV